MSDSPWDSTQPIDVSEPVVEKPKKSRFWKFLAWAGIAIGIIGLQSAITKSQSAKELIGNCLLAIALIVPALLWFHYEKLDAKAYEEAAENARNYQFLTPEDRALLGDGLNNEPKLVKRRWGLITVLALLTFSFGGSLIPHEETENGRPATTADSKPTGEPEATTVTTTMYKTTTASSASTSAPADLTEKGSTEEAGVRSSYAPLDDETYATERVPAYESPVPSSIPEDTVVEPAPTAVPTPVQEPASAPSSGGSSYYANCSEARAAGVAPLYAGEPGYRSGLDRDNDGIACE